MSQQLTTINQQLTKTFRSRKVLVTGHTGFKGAWLCEWLLTMGAQVNGLALEPDTEPNLFTQLGLSDRMDHRIGDIRDLSTVQNRIREVQPDVVFHLAAQPLVRLSYEIPVETFNTNVMGSIHVMEALREIQQPCAVVMVTTDKCYENREWLHGYREEDPMGGYDPYSASKGCAEIAIAAYRRSFFAKGHPIQLASARAGNVIGGGDWAKDRIVPDTVRALKAGNPVPVRNKIATRPWQHVLEPLSGYLLLAARLTAEPALAGAYNFGPALSSNRTVAELVQEGLKHWQGKWDDCSDPNAPHEAGKLNLATDKAFHTLGWSPRWNFETTVARTIAWYKAAHDGANIPDLVKNDLIAYVG